MRVLWMSHEGCLKSSGQDSGYCGGGILDTVVDDVPPRRVICASFPPRTPSARGQARSQERFLLDDMLGIFNGLPINRPRTQNTTSFAQTLNMTRTGKPWSDYNTHYSSPVPGPGYISPPSTFLPTSTTHLHIRHCSTASRRMRRLDIRDIRDIVNRES